MKWLEDKLAELEARIAAFHARCDAAISAFESAKAKVATLEAQSTSDGGPGSGPPPP